MACPAEDEWLAFLGGELVDAALEGFEEHLDDCPECRLLFAALQRNSEADNPTVRPLVAANRPELAAGDRLAHFRIERLLGKGGMGEVYLATDIRLGRQVALKLLPAASADDEAFRDRFYREAQAQAQIRHPNICQIYFIGEEDKRLFFAMEHIEGESLQDRLQRDGALPAAEALELCRMAALGLREAARHGFTHRDIKPSNLMIDRDGTLKIVDFGLVKQALEQASAQAEGVPERTGLVGTPLYMAPEQARGESLDFRADIYALGATLHHLVAGRPALTGDTKTELHRPHSDREDSQLGEHKRPRAAKRSGAEPVARLCDQMMAKQPEARFESYDALIAAMDRASPTRTRPASMRARGVAFAIDVACVSALDHLAVFLAKPHAELEIGNAPFYILFAAYHLLGHTLWGKTLGKFILSIELEREDGGRVHLAQAALRFAALWGPMYALGLAQRASEWALGINHTVTWVLYVVWIFVTFFPCAAAGVTGYRDPRKRAYWDVWAKTAVHAGAGDRSSRNGPS